MHKLKQSAAEWCYFNASKAEPATYYSRLKAMGLSGTEMPDPSRFAAVRAAGLEIVNIHTPGMEKGMNYAENHAELLPQIRAVIATAAQNKIPQVIVFSGNRNGISDEKGLANTVAALKQLAVDAQKGNVTLALEMLSSTDHKDYHADTTKFMFDAIRQVNSPNVKGLYDIYHVQKMGEPILETLLPNLKDICHIHMAATPKRNIPTKNGEIDYPTIVKKVHAAGYRGFWGQEFRPTGDALQELETATKMFESFVD